MKNNANDLNKHTKHTVASALLAATLFLAACGGAGSAKPATAVITAPAANSDVLTGQVVTIQGQADGSNITRVDVVVDSATLGSVAASDAKQGVASLPVVITWTTQLVGTHFAQLNVYGQDNKIIGKSDAVIFNTKAAPVTAAPTQPPATPTQAATAIPTAAPLATAANVTGTTSVTSSVATTTTTTTSSTAASLTINNENGFANIRSGPDTTYDLIGKLNQGESAPVKGKNQEGTWWQIAFAAGTGGVGWVRGDLVQANAATASVPVVQAPPKPTAPPATATSSAPVGPTATPPSVAVATATASGPVCDASSPDWRGSNPNYPFCAKQDLNWGVGDWEWTVFDNGRDGKIWLSWNMYGANINQVWIHFVHDASLCGFDRATQKTINQQVAPAGRFDFNTIDFPYGGTYKVYLEITLTDGRVVQWGEKKLCIR